MSMTQPLSFALVQRGSDRAGLNVRQNWIQTPTLPLVNRLTLGQCPHISDNAEQVFPRENKELFIKCQKNKKSQERCYNKNANLITMSWKAK